MSEMSSKHTSSGKVPSSLLWVCGFPLCQLGPRPLPLMLCLSSYVVSSYGAQASRSVFPLPSSAKKTTHLKPSVGFTGLLAIKLFFVLLSVLSAIVALGCSQLLMCWRCDGSFPATGSYYRSLWGKVPSMWGDRELRCPLYRENKTFSEAVSEYLPVYQTRLGIPDSESHWGVRTCKQAAEASFYIKQLWAI